MAAKCVSLYWADHELSRSESEFYDELVQHLRNEGLTVYYRPRWADATHRHIVQSGREAVASCDCLVVILNRESDSLGWIVGETGGRIPILFLKPESRTRLTRTFLGLVELNEAELQTYAQESQLLPLILNFLKNIETKNPAD